MSRAQSTTADYIRARSTFIKSSVVERTNKAEIRREEQSETVESCRENVWNEIQLKGPLRQKKRHKNRIKKEKASSVGLCQKHKPQHPHHVNVSPLGLISRAQSNTKVV